MVGPGGPAADPGRRGTTRRPAGVAGAGQRARYAGAARGSRHRLHQAHGADPRVSTGRDPDEPGRARARRAADSEQARQWWDQALSVRTRAVAERPDDRQAWKELGIVRAELGQPEAAVTAFTKLVDLTPESRDENLWWATDPAGIGETLAAYDAIFARVVQVRPRDRTLLIARFHYFGRRRRWREAAEMAARIVALDPQDR